MRFLGRLAELGFNKPVQEERTGPISSTRLAAVSVSFEFGFYFKTRLLALKFASGASSASLS